MLRRNNGTFWRLPAPTFPVDSCRVEWCCGRKPERLAAEALIDVALDSA